VNELLAEYLGIITGDGCLSLSRPSAKGTGNKYYIFICGHSIDDADYLRQVKQMTKDLFNKEVNIITKSSENCSFIKFSNKNVFYQLAEYIPIGKKYNSIRIPNEILTSNELFYAFIKGYFDTDGTIIHVRDNYPRLEIKSKSHSLLNQALTKLRQLGFYGSLSKCAECFRLELAGHKNFKRWLKLIGFRNKKHLNKVLISS